MYEYNKEELYEWALFSFEREKQLIEMTFIPIDGDAYMFVVYSADKEKIKNPHEPGFAMTLNKILSEFDNGRCLRYVIRII